MALASIQASALFMSMVRDLAEELGSQAAAARKLGISPAYVSRIFRDEVGQVREKTILFAESSLGLAPGSFESGNIAQIVRRPAATRPADAYDLVRAMDARELRAFRAWFLAWTDPADESNEGAPSAPRRLADEF